MRTVVVTALMAMVCGADDAEAMEQWGKANAEWLAGIVEMPHGPPTQDVYLAVFAALNNEALDFDSAGAQRADGQSSPVIPGHPRQCAAISSRSQRLPGSASKRRLQCSHTVKPVPGQGSGKAT